MRVLLKQDLGRYIVCLLAIQVMQYPFCEANPTRDLKVIGWQKDMLLSTLQHVLEYVQSLPEVNMDAILSQGWKELVEEMGLEPALAFSIASHSSSEIISTVAPSALQLAK